MLDLNQRRIRFGLLVVTMLAAIGVIAAPCFRPEGGRPAGQAGLARAAGWVARR